VVVVALLILTIVLVRRLGRLSQRLESITRGSDEQSLESVLGSHLERVRQVVRDVDLVAARTAVLERDIKGSLGRVAVVRYNPFEETGGNQSFALAIVDARGDGFVVSSLHARAGTRVYAKGVTGGKAETALSDEEAQALQQAIAKPAAGSGR
jgi:Na+-transporting methylmalonyl-CoA/oxaloacetate decarboxylase gamma subunit